MKYVNFIRLGSIGILTFLLFGLAACGVFNKSTSNIKDEQTQKPPAIEKSGAVLWGENCSRCHNAPNAGAFTKKQWETIGKHMRIRANLTADETEKIIGFLQLTN